MYFSLDINLKDIALHKVILNPTVFVRIYIFWFVFWDLLLIHFAALLKKETLMMHLSWLKFV